MAKDHPDATRLDNETIVIYTSKFCFHSQAVVRFFKSRDYPFRLVSIDGNQQARQELMAKNRGYASVPTLLFPDGTQLTEPSFGEIKSKLGIEQHTIRERVRDLFSKQE